MFPPALAKREVGRHALRLDKAMPQQPPQGPPPVGGISELVLEVADLEASRAFYGDLLGFEETRLGERREDRRWYLIGESARLGLWTPQVGLAGGRGGAHVHFAFAIDDPELGRLRERLLAGGAEVEGPVQLGPGRAIYVTDPDGNVVEFWSQDMAEYTTLARRKPQR
jgi:catechol-2,3-dioxygenase